MSNAQSPQASMNSQNTQNSLMKSLFFGEIREDLLFPYPKMSKETSETVSMVLDSIDKFAKDNVNSTKWDEEGKMPREVLSMAAELGLMGLGVPEEFGGLGFNQMAYARIFQTFSQIDASLAALGGDDITPARYVCTCVQAIAAEVTPAVRAAAAPAGVNDGWWFGKSL